MYAYGNSVKYFDSFGVNLIPKEIKKCTTNKNIIATTFRIQVYDSIMCGYFNTKFIDFMFKGKNLTDFSVLYKYLSMATQSLRAIPDLHLNQTKILTQNCDFVVKINKTEKK